MDENDFEVYSEYFDDEFLDNSKPLPVGRKRSRAETGSNVQAEEDAGGVPAKRVVLTRIGSHASNNGSRLKGQLCEPVSLNVTVQDEVVARQQTVVEQKPSAVPPKSSFDSTSVRGLLHGSQRLINQVSRLSQKATIRSNPKDPVLTLPKSLPHSIFSDDDPFNVSDDPSNNLFDDLNGSKKQQGKIIRSVSGSDNHRDIFSARKPDDFEKIKSTPNYESVIAERSKGNNERNGSASHIEFPTNSRRCSQPTGLFDLQRVLLNVAGGIGGGHICLKSQCNQLEEKKKIQTKRPPINIDYLDFEAYSKPEEVGGTAKYGVPRQRQSFLSEPIKDLEARINRERESNISSSNSSIPQYPKDWNPGSDKLWSSKYQPKSYLELLTDEGINRQILKWLKEFDKTLGTWKNKTSVNVVQQQSITLNTLQQQKSLMKAKEMNESGKNAETPDQSIPVLLLAGPPGVGKTTCVHLLARQAGFEVIEVNSSDDRTKDKITMMVKSVSGIDTGMLQSYISKAKKTESNGYSGRPTLLLLDEIEGCDRDAVEALVKLIDNKDKNGRLTIKRPIICCCNDLYHRSLKSLRARVKVINVGPPDEQRLIKRLIEICCKEGLQIDGQCLPKLVQQCYRDIRAILNSLQYLARSCCSNDNSKSRLTVQEVEKYWEVLHRDRDISELEVIQNLFMTPNKPQEKASRCHWMTLKDIILTIDLDIFLLTLQDNLSKVSYPDPCVDKLAYLSDLICEADCLRTRNRTGNKFAIFFPILMIRAYCASSFPPNPIPLNKLIPYPLSLGCRALLLGNRRMQVRSILSAGMLPHQRTDVMSSYYPIDVIAPLVFLTSPSLLFGANSSSWRSYNRLHIRPPAGVPLEGYLSDPLNRFHHMMELCVAHSLKYSPAPSVDISNPLTKPIYFQNNRNRSWNNEYEASFSKRINYLDPPLHLFVERYCKDFFTAAVKPRVGGMINVPKLKTHVTGEGSDPILLWDSSASFELLNAKFTGYDYINLQLSRVHADLLKHEIENFLKTGLLPNCNMMQNGEQQRKHSRYIDGVNGHGLTVMDDLIHGTGDKTHGDINHSSSDNGSSIRYMRVGASPLSSVHLPLMEDIPQFLYRFQRLQLKRREWEAQYWRGPEATNISSERTDHFECENSMPNRVSDQYINFESHENSKLTNDLLDAIPVKFIHNKNSPAMVGKHPLNEYRHLFEMEYKCNKILTFHYESGDAKAVKYTPSLKDLFG